LKVWDNYYERKEGDVRGARYAEFDSKWEKEATISDHDPPIKQRHKNNSINFSIKGVESVL